MNQRQQHPATGFTASPSSQGRQPASPGRCESLAGLACRGRGPLADGPTVVSLTLQRGCRGGALRRLEPCGPLSGRQWRRNDSRALRTGPLRHNAGVLRANLNGSVEPEPLRAIHLDGSGASDAPAAPAQLSRDRSGQTAGRPRHPSLRISKNARTAFARVGVPPAGPTRQPRLKLSAEGGFAAPPRRGDDEPIRRRWWRAPAPS